MDGPREAEPESLAKTLGVAASVAFGCALIVSTAVYWLRPIQLASSSIDLSRAVVEAAGLASADEPPSDLEVVNRFLDFEVRVFDVAALEFTRAIDPGSYDFRTDLEADQPRYLPVYFSYDDGAVARAVLPFFGRGMWSTIRGMLALEDDLSTIAGLAIYEHGETPGIGDRIEDPVWLAEWRGKRLYDDRGALRFRVAADVDPSRARYTVDSITGATVTASALDRAVTRWFGSEGYGPVLASLRARAP